MRAEFNEEGGQFSPDGRWIAYSSQESGREEVYVRPFSPDPPAAQTQGGKWQVSASGGYQPRWSWNGKELYYCALDGKLMAVNVTTDPAFRAEAPTVLFQGLSQGSIATLYSWWDLNSGQQAISFPGSARSNRENTLHRGAELASGVEEMRIAAGTRLGACEIVALVGRRRVPTGTK